MPVLRSNRLPIQHPGVVFKRYYLDRYNIKLSDAAKTLNLKISHLNNFLNGEATVTTPWLQNWRASLAFHQASGLIYRKATTFIHNP